MTEGARLSLVVFTSLALAGVVAAATGSAPWRPAAVEPAGERESEGANVQDPSGSTWQAFRLSEVDAERASAGSPWRQFLAEPSMRVGLYVLEPDQTDRQQPHEQDEVYHVVEGRGVLTVGDDEIPVEPGSVVFVEAGADHRFSRIDETLNVLVVFAPGA